MQLFVDETALKRAGALELLYAMPYDFPGMQEARSAQVKGGAPGAILSDAWRVLVRDYERFNQDMFVLRTENENLRSQVAEYRFHPLAKEVKNLHAALQESNAQVKTCKATIAELCAEIDAGQRTSRMDGQEIERLINVVADQNRVIAEQHKKLVSLLGDE